MATTILVDDSTKQMLERIKQERGVSSFDKVITELIKKEKSIPDSMFGAAKGLKLKKLEKFDFHELELPVR